MVRGLADIGGQSPRRDKALHWEAPTSLVVPLTLRLLSQSGHVRRGSRLDVLPTRPDRRFRTEDSSAPCRTALLRSFSFWLARRSPGAN